MSNEIFQKLYNIDISPYVEHYGNIDYLEWSVTWRLLKTAYPDSTFEIFENKEGLPYFETPYGIFVKVAITVTDENEIKRREIDWYDAEPNVNASTITKAHQRALCKAAARLGLALRLWEKKGRGELGKSNSEPSKTSETKPGLRLKKGGKTISPAQVGRYKAISLANKWSFAELDVLLKQWPFYSKIEEFGFLDYDDIIAELQKGPPSRGHKDFEEPPPPSDDDLGIPF